MSSADRRLVFGLNVALNVVLAVAVLALAVWAAGALDQRVDLSSLGANSLSPRTQSLLRGLQEDVRLTALYTTALKELRPLDEKRRDRVAALLDLYETASRGRVATAMLEPTRDEARRTELLARLRQKPAFADEAAPHVAALERFAAFQQRIAELATSESQELDRLSQVDMRMARVPQVTIIRRALRDILQDTDQTARDIERLRTEAVPRYGEATSAMSQYFESVRRGLQGLQAWMTTEAPSLPGLEPETAEFFRRAQARFEPLLADLTAEITALQDLKPVRLEQTYDALAQGQAILVETSQNAEVLSLDDVWPMRMDRNAPPPADGDPREFAGEQAVSSAILKLTQKERTGVVFVRAGGAPLLRPDFSQMQMMMQMPPPAPYERLADVLRRQNFVVEEWDVAASMEPPKVEGAARLVYVVTPPAPPSRANPMMAMQPGITPEQKLAVQSAVESAAGAVFLAGWSPPMSGSYAWQDYLRSGWRVEVRDEYLVLQYAPNPNKPDRWWPANRDPLMVTSDVLSLSNHPIVRPLGSMPLGLARLAPLAVAAPPEPGDDGAPAAAPDVTHETLVELRGTENAWATRNVERLQEDLEREQGTYRRPDDLPGPQPAAIAATKPSGRKIVVFGSERFISDDVAQTPALMLTSAGLVGYLPYPGNSDLFINAVHWLAGEADRISVGVRSGDVPRLDRLKDGPLYTFCRVFLVGIWPMLALVAGGAVWLRRR